MCCIPKNNLSMFILTFKHKLVITQIKYGISSKLLIEFERIGSVKKQFYIVILSYSKFKFYMIDQN